MSERRTALVRRLNELSSAQLDSIAGVIGEGPRSEGAARLTAYVASREVPPDPRGLAEHLASRLPEYMVPSSFVHVDRLPRTPAGKIDRGALGPSTGRELETAADEMIAPRTETERRLARIWIDVIGVEEVGVHDNFFEIGGDSLLSVRMIARAGRDDMSIAPKTFFEGPTIAQLARHIEAGSSPMRSPADQGPVVGECPLTPIQAWFFERFSVGRDHWNQSRVFRLSDGVTRHHVERALSGLIAHHDALRLRIIARDGEHLQHFDAPGADASLRTVDLSAAPHDARPALLDRECTREHAALRLAEGGLFRALLFEDAREAPILVLIAHHVLVDAFSWDLLTEDLSTLLSGAVASVVAELPSKTTSARDWASALQQAATRPEMLELAATWAIDVPPAATAWPGAESPSSGDDATCGKVQLDRHVTAGLAAVARRLGCRRQHVLLAGVALAWRSWTGNSQFQFDVEGHGRDLIETLDVSRTVGWFTTVFPILLDLSGQSPEQAVRSAGEALEALPFKGGSYGLARYYCPDRSLRSAVVRRPLSPLLFNDLGRPGAAVLGEGAPLAPLAVSSGIARSARAGRAYPIEINAYESNDRLTFDIELSCRIDAESADRFTAALSAAVHELVEPRSRGFELSGLDDTGLDTVADLLSRIDEA